MILRMHSWEWETASPDERQASALTSSWMVVTSGLSSPKYRPCNSCRWVWLVFKSPVAGPMKNRQPNRTNNGCDRTAVAGPRVSAISSVAVALAQAKIKDWSQTGHNRSFEGSCRGGGQLIYLLCTVQIIALH